jgi:enoyl-CoA hydratase/carnithine racemase
MPSHLLHERPHPGVLLLTLDRPERKNPFDSESAIAFAQELIAANSDPETRVIVLTGAGGNFCSGADLDDFANLSERKHPPPGQRMMEALNECAKPVIAAVEGLAVGGGVTLLLHFDLVYAARSARFRLPFVNLGTCPEGASSYYLPMNAGVRKASELLLLGDFFDVDTAIDAGIVNTATADGEALAAALASAQKIASKSPESIRLTKMLIREGHRAHVRLVIAREHGLFTERLHTEEVQANIAALIAPKTKKAGVQ